MARHQAHQDAEVYAERTFTLANILQQVRAEELQALCCNSTRY